MGVVWGWLMVWLVWPPNKHRAPWRTAVWLIIYTAAVTMPLALLYTPNSAFIFLASTAVGAIANAIAWHIILEQQS